MKTWLVILSVVAILLAVAAGIGFRTLAETRIELVQARVELASTNADLAAVQAELDVIKAELAAVQPEPPPSPPPEQVCDTEDAIPWHEARDHIGERITVYGPVVDTYYASGSSGRPTFLNIGNAYPNPNRLTVVIWGTNRGKFAQPPEDYFLGKTVCVTGLVVAHDGVPQIEVTSPDQIYEP